MTIPRTVARTGAKQENWPHIPSVPQETTPPKRGLESSEGLKVGKQRHDRPRVSAEKHRDVVDREPGPKQGAHGRGDVGTAHDVVAGGLRNRSSSGAIEKPGRLSARSIGLASLTRTIVRWPFE
jgi:hypothetical protein